MTEMNKAKELFEKMSGISPEEVTDGLLNIGEVAGSFTPYLKGALTYLKFKKIGERIKENEEKINKITDKLSYHEDLFYKEEVFPIIFNRMLNEEQDEKIPIILQGFEHILDEEIKEIEEVYYFYDVLSELRISDIFYLTERYNVEYRGYNDPLRIKTPRLRDENPEKYHKRKDLNNYISNKLLQLGVLQYSTDTKISSSDNLSSFRQYQGNDPLKIANVEISNFGYRFIKFFEVEDI